MATISENLQTIKNSTDAIKQAIIDKGGNISGDITTWADAISGIETGGGGSSSGEAVTFTGRMTYTGDLEAPVVYTITGYISSTLDVAAPNLVAIFVGQGTPSIVRTFIQDVTQQLTLSINTNIPADMVLGKTPALFLASVANNTIYPVKFIEEI